MLIRQLTEGRLQIYERDVRILSALHCKSWVVLW